MIENEKFDHKKNEDAKVKVIVGKRGYGKTTLSKIFAQNEERLIVIDPLEEYSDLIVCEKITDLVDYLKFNKSFRLSILDDSKSEQIFQLAWLLTNVTIIIEEVDIICKPSYISEQFGNCIKRGRHRGINLIASSRRPAEINRLLTSQCNELITFCITEPLDLKYLNSYTEGSQEIIKSLEKFEFLTFPDNKKCKIIDFNKLVNYNI